MYSLMWFIEKYGKIDFLQIQTYTIDEKTIYTILELLNAGKIEKLQLIITETAVFRIPKIYNILKELFSNHENCNLCFYWKCNVCRCVLFLTTGFESTFI